MRVTLVLIGHSVRRLRGLLLGMAAVLAGFQLLLAAMADWLRTQFVALGHEPILGFN